MVGIISERIEQFKQDWTTVLDEDVILALCREIGHQTHHPPLPNHAKTQASLAPTTAQRRSYVLSGSHSTPHLFYTFDSVFKKLFG